MSDRNDEVEKLLKEADEEVEKVNKYINEFIAESKREWSKEFNVQSNSSREYAEYARELLQKNMEELENFTDLKPIQ